MDALTIGAVLLAIVSGASGELGSQLWDTITSLIRRPAHRRRNAASGEAELAALQQAPADRQRATALAAALLARADTDPDFAAALRRWWDRAAPIHNNIITGGTYHAPVLQATTINATFTTPPTPAAAAPPVAAQLPPPMPAFTGRDHELATLATLLDPTAGTVPVLVSAVAGQPGVGKTTLATQAAHAAQRSGWYPGGIVFLNLRGYDPDPVTPGQALDTVLRVLTVPPERIPPDTGERAALYRSALAHIPGPMLIIADNAAAEAQIRPLLPGTGPHRVLVTSRHTLAGLGARLLDILTLTPADATALLHNALHTARPGDTRITADPAAAQRVAAACGGLPLALNITAALLIADPTLTAADLASDLDDEQHRLDHLRYDDGSGPTAPSVNAAFELSYQRLDSDTARMFRLLAIHPGPDAPTSAAAVLTSQDPAHARRTLAALAQAHLIEPAPTAPGRWRMHDLIRLYARHLSGQHADTDHRDHALDQILTHYLHLVRAADQHLRALPGDQVPDQFTGRPDALAWLDTNRPTLIAATHLAADTGRYRIALHFPLDLSAYLDWRRRFDDMLVILAISLTAARALGDRHSEGAALNSLGVALQQVRRFEEAITACHDAAAIYRETGDRHREGTALGNLGAALVEVRRFEEAITADQDAAAIYRETGDRHGEGTALNNLGLALREVRRFEEAITACHDAAAICRETGDRHGEGTALNNLGAALMEVRRFEEAITACHDAAAICRETGDRHSEGMAQSSLGVALVEVRRFEEAITAHQDAAAIFQETGDRHGEGMALGNLGVALVDVRRFEEAITACHDAAAIYRETGDRHGEGMALGNLGAALREVRRFQEAITACHDAAAIFQETGDRHSEGAALGNLGLALREVRRFEEAITAHQDAAAICRETGDRHSEGMTLNNLGLALREVRRFEEAITADQDAAAIFQETGDRHREGIALNNLREALAAQQEQSGT